MRKISFAVQIFAAALACALSLGAAAATASTFRDEATRPIFERKRNEAWGCYEKTLLADPLARGKVTLRLDVAADGHVEAVTLERPEIQDPDFQRCLIATAKTWRFEDATKGEAGVARYAYSFAADPTLAPISSKPKTEPLLTGPGDSIDDDPADAALLQAPAGPAAPEAPKGL